MTTRNSSPLSSEIQRRALSELIRIAPEFSQVLEAHGPPPLWHHYLSRRKTT